MTARTRRNLFKQDLVNHYHLYCFPHAEQRVICSSVNWRPAFRSTHGIFCLGNGESPPSGGKKIKKNQMSSCGKTVHHRAYA